MGHCPVSPNTNYTDGRECDIQAIVLHRFQGGIDAMDRHHGVDRSPMADQCHQSFHYGISGCVIRQYVEDENTAWSFDDDGAICYPIDWPVADANPDTDVDCYTINIAVDWGIVHNDCNTVVSRRFAACLGDLICGLLLEHGLALSPDTVWIHNSELPMSLYDAVMEHIEQCIEEGGPGGGGPGEVLDPYTSFLDCEGNPIPNGASLALCDDVTGVGATITNCAGTELVDGDSVIACTELGTQMNTLNVTDNEGANIDWTTAPCLITCVDLANALPVVPTYTNCAGQDLVDGDSVIACTELGRQMNTLGVTSVDGTDIDWTTAPCLVTCADLADAIPTVPTYTNCAGQDLLDGDSLIACTELGTQMNTLNVTNNAGVNIDWTAAPCIVTCDELAAVTPNVADCQGQPVNITDPDTAASFLTCANATDINNSIQDCNGDVLQLFNPAVVNRLATCDDLSHQLTNCNGDALDIFGADPVPVVACSEFGAQMNALGAIDCNGQPIIWDEAGNPVQLAQCADVGPVTHLADCDGNALDASDAGNPLRVVTCTQLCTSTGAASACTPINVFNGADCSVTQIPAIADCATLSAQRVTTVSMGIDPSDKCSITYQQNRSYMRYLETNTDGFIMNALIHNVVGVDASGGDLGIVLPDMSAADCFTPTDFHVKRLDAVVANTLTVTGSGGALIDGAASVTLSTPSPFSANRGESIHVVWSGSEWIII